MADICHSLLSRRHFLALTGQGVIGLSLLSCVGRVRNSLVISTRTGADGVTFSVREWEMLEAIQDHLLPSAAGSPGARDVNATGYLDAALTGSDVDPLDAEKIKQGLVGLEASAFARGKEDFASLSSDEREAALRAFEETEDGEIWLTLVMGYTLEAFLGDPAYGGNPDGVAWKWLNHSPGYPEPPLVQIGMRR